MPDPGVEPLTESRGVEPAFLTGIRPYYSDERTTIYHADCRTILPTLTADAVLTDLPYGVGIAYDTYNDTPESLTALIDDTLPLMLAAAPVVAITSGTSHMWRYPTPTWVLCWHQTNGATGFGRWGTSQWQPVLVYGKDPHLSREGRRLPDVISIGSSGIDLRDTGLLDHPCPKPLAAWRAILRRVSPDESDVILDPFMGSGTTLVAAKYSGRHAIGIDVSERYCELAATRLGQAVLDLA